jgi:uncharacterized membrane protein YdjX (TVP38/TMEM64 family)
MQEILSQIISNNPILGPISFIAFRALAIIIPPIPGVILDLAGYVAFGPILAFLYAEIGVVTGAMTTFFLARYFREPLVHKFVAVEKLNEWQSHLSTKVEFWSLVALRFMANPVFDYLGYISGLTKISWVRFLITTVIGVTPQLFIIYYFGFLSFNKSIYYGGAGILFAVFILYFAVPYIMKKLKK